MSWCQPYQPLPISTGTVGIDRCGNIEVYAAPSVVRNCVQWGCWPIQCQQPGWPPGPPYGGPSGGCGYPGWGGGLDWLWWMVQGGVDPGFSAPPWWGPWNARSGGSIQQAAAARGTAMADWVIATRRGGGAPMPARAA